MTSRLAWLVIGLFVVWSGIAHQWYVCHIKQACERVIEATVGEDEVGSSTLRPVANAGEDNDQVLATEPKAAPTRLIEKPEPTSAPINAVQFDERVDIRFAHASVSAQADDDLERFLDRLAAHLKQSAAVVTLIGHTDSKGTAAFNQQLGLRRAEHIRDQLIVRGIASGRLKVMSKGGTSPLASNDTEEGRQQNRRVEVVLDDRP